MAWNEYPPSESRLAAERRERRKVQSVVFGICFVIAFALAYGGYVSSSKRDVMTDECTAKGGKYVKVVGGEYICVTGVIELGGD